MTLQYPFAKIPNLHASWLTVSKARLCCFVVQVPLIEDDYLDAGTDVVDSLIQLLAGFI